MGVFGQAGVDWGVAAIVFRSFGGGPAIAYRFPGRPSLAVLANSSVHGRLYGCQVRMELRILLW